MKKKFIRIQPIDDFVTAVFFHDYIIAINLNTDNQAIKEYFNILGQNYMSKISSNSTEIDMKNFILSYSISHLTVDVESTRSVEVVQVNEYLAQQSELETNLTFNVGWQKFLENVFQKNMPVYGDTCPYCEQIGPTCYCSDTPKLRFCLSLSQSIQEALKNAQTFSDNSNEAKPL